MTKKEKFKKIIDFLGKLKSSQFNYRAFVQEFDEKNKCGTVCCVAGWFPAIFPKNFKWVNRNSMNSVDEKRIKFLGIDDKLNWALFYGDKEEQEGLGLPITNLNSNLKQVIKLFKAYYKTI